MALIARNASAAHQIAKKKKKKFYHNPTPNLPKSSTPKAGALEWYLLANSIIIIVISSIVAVLGLLGKIDSISIFSSNIPIAIIQAIYYIINCIISIYLLIKCINYVKGT